MRIETLKASQIDLVMDLFCTCFQDDPFYGQLFPDVQTRRLDMRGFCTPSILYCLEHGSCLGIWDDRRLLAFSICFDYRRIYAQDRPAFLQIFGGDPDTGTLPDQELLHQVVLDLPGDIIYSVSLAVHPEFQHMGLASGLVDQVLQAHPGCFFVSDVSNEPSLTIYRARNCTITPIRPGYYLVIHAPEQKASTAVVGPSVRVALPDPAMLDRAGISYHLRKAKLCLPGLIGQCAYGISYFIPDRHAVASASVVELSYPSYLEFQRLINVSQYTEHAAGDYVYYVLTTPYLRPPLLNDTLEAMLPTRQSEWALIPDVYVSIPVRYQSRELLRRWPAPEDARARFLLRQLAFRTNYESGVPSSLENVDDLAGFKKRIQRFYLGKIQVQIATEITPDSDSELGDPIGAPAFVDLYISIDLQSQCGVLTLFSLSAPFLLSHLMDNVIRNNLMVVGRSDTLNLFDYVKTNFQIIKRGTPKIFVVTPKDRSCLKPSQLASLLASETIYPDGEVFGQIIDAEIVAAASSEIGMGQYDRAFVCAYTNVLLQFSPDFYATLCDRISEESITLFYIELILLEEAAIHIADQEIIRLSTSDAIAEPVEFLQRVSAIYDDYSRTIEFWDIQVNYPTSQKSITMLRNAFRIKEQLEYMQRNQAQLQTVFDIKCDIIDRNDAKRMDTSLAILSILAIFSAWIDGYDYLSTWDDVLTSSAIHILQRVLFVLILITAGYAVTHLFGNKLALLIRRRRDRSRRHKRKRRS